MIQRYREQEIHPRVQCAYLRDKTLSYHQKGDSKRKADSVRIRKITLAVAGRMNPRTKAEIGK